MDRHPVTLAVAKAFDRYDRDHSGVLDKAELSSLCSYLGANLNELQMEAAFRLLDKDNSGGISKDEFIAWWLSRGQDLDGDGKVDELERRLGDVALTGTNEAVCAHIEAIREDRDTLNREILLLEEDRARLQKQIVSLQDNLARLNEDLQYQYKARKDIDLILQETESAYLAILSSSQNLLDAVQRHMPSYLSTRR